MSASESRFVAIWASHEARARLWLRLFVLTAAGLGSGSDVTASPRW